ncbi:MAG: hypothetical protein ABWY78_06445 [Microvirga sp.]
MSEPQSLTLSDLDELRAQVMRCLLDDTGRREIWKYDIMPARAAYREALERYDFDNMRIGSEAIAGGQPFALVGPGIVDHPFGTPAELLDRLVWLCCEGYLGCYARRLDGAA